MSFHVINVTHTHETLCPKSFFRIMNKTSLAIKHTQGEKDKDTLHYMLNQIGFAFLMDARILLTKRPNLIGHCEGILGISDHDTIACITTNMGGEIPGTYEKKHLAWQQVDIESMRSEMSNFSQEFLFN